jgi:hypothetical protein
MRAALACLSSRRRAQPAAGWRPAVSLDRKRWALLAADLKFSQLGIARQQAGIWRTGLATLTTLLTGVLVVKGRDDASAITRPFQIVAAALLGLALMLLLWATTWVSRALAGPPGEKILLTGEDLEKWTRGEVRKISTALLWVPRLAVASVLAVAVAVAVTWFAPAQDTFSPFVLVTDSTGQQTCGELIGVTKHQLLLEPATGPTLLPISSVDALTPVTLCP